MSVKAEGSVTRWISDLKAGDSDAARPLWDRYFADLVRVARTKLRATRRPGADEEFDRQLDALEIEDLRRVALWRVEGFTIAEIADRLGRARRTVARRLDLIRKTRIEAR